MQSSFEFNLVKDKFESTRSIGSYETLYSFSNDPLVQKELIKSLNEEHLKVGQLVDLFYDLIELFGYDRGTKGSIQRERHWKAYDKLIWSFNCYVFAFGRDSWVELFKWKTSAFFAYIFNACNIPRVPRQCEIFKNPFKLFYGRAQTYLLHMKHDQQRLFANSVLMLKKGAPPVSEDIILEKRIEVYEQLTKKPSPLGNECEVVPPFKGVSMEHIRFNSDREDWERVNHHETWKFQVARTIEYSEERLKHFITKVVSECFRGKRLTEKKIFQFTFPSLSANYNMSRKAGGGLGEVVEQIEDLKYKMVSDYLSDDGFHGYDFFDHSFSTFLFDLTPKHLADYCQPQKAKFSNEFPVGQEGLCFSFNDKILHSIQ
jgi:hypothetical protein